MSFDRAKELYIRSLNETLSEGEKHELYEFLQDNAQWVDELKSFETLRQFSFFNQVPLGKGEAGEESIADSVIARLIQDEATAPTQKNLGFPSWFYSPLFLAACGVAFVCIAVVVGDLLFPSEQIPPVPSAVKG